MKEITLSKGKVALVSEEDFEFLSQWKWSASLESRGTKWYAIRWSTKAEHGEGKRFKIRMHRVIANPATIEMVVDHKVGLCVLGHDHPGDSLDNRRCGLEVISQEENMERAKGWKGSRTWKEKKTEECFL
jgi:hypothetical protein